MRHDNGFTLVEILVVVILLGILAAIVVPQFVGASNQARDSAIARDLQAIRGQLELYKSQHVGQYPGVVEDGSFDAALFKEQLTHRTNQAGETGADSALYPCGPYMHSFPVNCYAVANADGVAGGAGDPEGDGDPGWFFNTSTGKFSSNDTAHSDW